MATTDPVSPEPIPVWWTDASRLAAQAHCEMDRYLGYHAGPNATGLDLKYSAMPLVTGIHIHKGMAIVMAAIRDQIPFEDLRDLWKLHADKVAEEYREEVKEGFRNKGAIPITAQKTVEEQICLMKALVYGWIRVSAEAFMENWEILHIEQEFCLDLPWDLAPWILRRGVKPDVVVRARKNIPVPGGPAVSKGVLVNWDWKTASTYSTDSLQEWADSPQQMVNCYAVGKALGEKVHGWMIGSLIKGRWSGSYDKKMKDYSGPKQQQSFFCYAWMRPADGIITQDFQPKGKWTELGTDGEMHGRSLGKSYPDKVPVWEFMDPFDWIDLMAKDVIAEAFVEAGVYAMEPYKVQQCLRGLQSGEVRWISKLDEAQASEDKWGWESSEHQENLDRIFNRSYACWRFGGDRCSQYEICFKQLGWKTLQNYKEREAHYEMEKVLMGGEE